MCGEGVGETGQFRQDDRMTGLSKLERTATIKGGGKSAEAKNGNALNVLEGIEEARDANAEQGTAESVQDVGMPELCVVLDASTKLEDMESSDDNGGEAGGLASTTA